MILVGKSGVLDILEHLSVAEFHLLRSASLCPKKMNMESEI